MRRFRAATLPLAAATLWMAVAALGLPGCARKVAGVDPSLVPPAFPEGVRGSLQDSPSDLVVWRDVPNELMVVSSDTTFTYAYRSREGAAVGVILDYFGGSSYELFRREESGGFRSFLDYRVTPSRRWAESMLYWDGLAFIVQRPAQLFAFADPFPPRMDTLRYIGRATLDGLTGAGFPLTNLGEVAAGADLMRIEATFDTLSGIQFIPVPNATGYWVHVFWPRKGVNSLRDWIEIGLPSPIALGKVTDRLVRYVPASGPAGTPASGSPGTRHVVNRLPDAPGLQWLLRISAVDGRGRMIATTGATGPKHEVRKWAEGSATYSIPLRGILIEHFDRLSGAALEAVSVAGAPSQPAAAGLGSPGARSPVEGR